MTQEETDLRFMQEALKEAVRAYEKDEVPVGAVIVADNRIIARCHNLTETLNDVTAHAEMQAITAAANTIGGKFLQECTIYVTVEPCVMCAGALNWSRVGRLVYAAGDNRKGFTNTGANLLHPKTVVERGPLAEESEGLMKSFFAKKR